MNESVSQFLGYVRGIWRYRWHALAAAWLLALVGWAVVFQLPDQYEATARVHVETRSALEPLLRGMTVDSNEDRRLRYMTRSLFTRPSLEKIARMSDLDLRVRSSEEMDDLLNDLSRRITLSGTAKVNIYEIGYTNQDPEVAKRVVQSVVSLMAERTLGESRRESDQAKAFLNKQVQEYEQRLEAAEERLMQFKRKHVGQMPSDKGDYYGRLQNHMGALEEARMKLKAAQSRRAELERLLSGEKPVFGIMSQEGGGSGPSPLQARIQNMQTRLDQLRLKYTEKHPEVKSLKSTIAELEGRLRDQRKGGGDQESGVPLESNPVYQELRASLAEAKAKIASLQEKVNHHKGKVESLREKVDTIPKVEAQLARLNRDYRATKEQYQELLERREKASISEKMKETSEDMKVEVIDPPHVPADPTSPDRPLLASMALVAALGGGGTGALLLSQARPVYESRQGLFQSTGYPVFGTICMVWSRRMQIRRQFLNSLFVLALAGLLGAYGMVLTYSMVDPEGAMSLVDRSWTAMRTMLGSAI